MKTTRELFTSTFQVRLDSETHFCLDISGPHESGEVKRFVQYTNAERSPRSWINKVQPMEKERTLDLRACGSDRFATQTLSKINFGQGTAILCKSDIIIVLNLWPRDCRITLLWLRARSCNRPRKTNKDQQSKFCRTRSETVRQVALKNSTDRGAHDIAS